MELDEHATTRPVECKFLAELVFHREPQRMLLHCTAIVMSYLITSLQSSGAEFAAARGNASKLRTSMSD
jgi:hypothetical protein